MGGGEAMADRRMKRTDSGKKEGRRGKPKGENIT